MRIATKTIYDIGTSGLSRLTSKQAQLQEQMSSGLRVVHPSDDPIAAARSLVVGESKSILQQYDKNIKTADSTLTQMDSTMTSMTTLLKNIKSLAVESGDAALNSANKDAINTQLQGYYDDLLALANTKDSAGSYIFSGYKTSTKAFSETTFGNVVYNGDQGVRTVQISATSDLPTSVAGDELFQKIITGNGTFTTSDNTANTGSGIIANGTVTDSAAWAASNKNFKIVFDVNTSVTPSVTTYDVVDTTTGNSLLTGAAASATGPYTATYSDGSDITIPGVGAKVVISGAPADGDSFTLAPSTNQDIFTSIGKLSAALENYSTSSNGQASFHNVLNNFLENLSNTMDNVLQEQAKVGASMNQTEALATTNSSSELNYSDQISDLVDLDYIEAYSSFAQNQVLLEAAQKSYVKVQGMSLFDYI